MIRIATERAHTQGLDNVEFHVVDADCMAPPANGFDVTVCRWALMFFADPPAASSHPPRTQAGWLAASTVGQPDRNPLVSTVVGAICGPHALPPPPLHRLSVNSSTSLGPFKAVSASIGG